LGELPIFERVRVDALSIHWRHQPDNQFGDES
jgi:hypothetical protein